MGILVPSLALLQIVVRLTSKSSWLPNSAGPLVVWGLLLISVDSPQAKSLSVFRMLSWPSDSSIRSCRKLTQAAAQERSSTQVLSTPAQVRAWSQWGSVWAGNSGRNISQSCLLGYGCHTKTSSLILLTFFFLTIYFRVFLLFLLSDLHINCLILFVNYFKIWLEGDDNNWAK